jgi:phenylacetate-CoA ligase
MIQYIKETFKYILRSKPFINSYIKEIEELYDMKEEKLQVVKEERFINIFRYAISKSKFYKSYYEESGIKINDIQSLTDIEKLPILTKEIVRKNYEKILTVPKWKVVKANTSGTTGTPLTVYNDYSLIRREQAYIWVRRKKHGFIFGEPLVSIRGNIKRDRVKLHVHISNTLFLSSYNLNKESTKYYYNEILKFRPKAIEGYPSSLYNLCCFFKELNFSLNIPLCFTSSETLFDFQRKVISEVLGTKIFDRYGCTERTISLSENINNEGYYEEPGYSFNEYNNDHILTTSLINKSFPLIRYKMDDIVLIEKHENKLIINSVVGRTDAYIICKDGSIIGRLDHIFKEVNNIRLAQIIQKRRGEIIINIVPEDNFNKIDEQFILKKVEERMGSNNIDSVIRKINEKDIIYSTRNKFNLVVSQL